MPSSATHGARLPSGVIVAVSKCETPVNFETSKISWDDQQPSPTQTGDAEFCGPGCRARNALIKERAVVLDASSRKPLKVQKQSTSQPPSPARKAGGPRQKTGRSLGDAERRGECARARNARIQDLAMSLAGQAQKPPQRRENIRLLIVQGQMGR